MSACTNSSVRTPNTVSSSLKHGVIAQAGQASLSAWPFLVTIPLTFYKWGTGITNNYIQIKRSYIWAVETFMSTKLRTLCFNESYFYLYKKKKWDKLKKSVISWTQKRPGFAGKPPPQHPLRGKSRQVWPRSIYPDQKSLKP